MAQRTAPWPAVHFVGVGGQSMSGLASALAELGVRTSGSDVSASERTARAQAAGVGVHIGHDRAHVRSLPPGAAVVFNTDVPADNPELAEARARGLALQHRSAILDWFLRAPGATAVAVTGTHGKTTTTSLCGLAVLATGLDPTIFVGADVPYLEGGNHRLGRGGVVVVEADESDGSFLRYNPDIAVITNVEPEHLEHYGGDFDRVLAAYAEFLGHIRPGGLAVMCADDPRLRVVAASASVEVLWYGHDPAADLTPADLRLRRNETRFAARLHGSSLGEFALAMPGRHNVSNALAAIGTAWRLGCDPTAVAAAFADFGGAVRRFQVLTSGRGVTVVDDYAHNPTKVAAAIGAARQRAEGRVLAVFQPHRYQRTAQLWDAFGPAFREADLLWLTDIYAPAGEARVPGVTGAALAELVGRGSGIPVRFVPDMRDVPADCLAEARPGDLVLVMGAGSITAIAREMAARLERGAAVG